MKREIIKRVGKTKIICDNPKCDFKEYDVDENELHTWINCVCPKCGQNLLTLGDFLRYVRVLDRVEKINKWFGWMTIFMKNPKENIVEVQTHNRIEIKHNENESN